MVIIGCRSENASELAAKVAVREIVKMLQLPGIIKDFRVTNIVASGELGYPIDLGRLA